VAAGIETDQPAERIADQATREAAERSIGEALFSLVDLSRRLRVDPELALRAAAQRFRDRAAND
jgi:XTP/dITP diphosphohydrolase/tetrapyrrole methylase family protein/MazG family protein/ATP diphosphatase